VSIQEERRRMYQMLGLDNTDSVKKFRNLFHLIETSLCCMFGSENIMRTSLIFGYRPSSVQV
jgi:hypothetical protein